ncbi:MAG TPA: UDP-N-acetylmuramoyl-L-alanyl-D-glutamate--2,6-diaminopimelate ligase [Rhodanobacteraceae bacterium]|nr:UDP-N-acetylmuramoyl-L-alanyl-D-glutamate--2,6-diaminopimelate ligase [Rhodanobacteraceae bacterium]
MSAGRSMTLAQLLTGHAEVGAAGDIVVRGLALDARQVRAGDAFVALRGGRHHGFTFAPEALASGASAVLAERPRIEAPASAPIPAGMGQAQRDVPVIWMDDLQARLGPIASRFFGDPSAALCVIGVTGTNGKTSTVQLLAQALSGCGRRVASIGTLGAGLHGAIREGERTTPDAIAVHGLLAGFLDAGASHVAMEVSSHALTQGRVNGVAFDVAVFTNLTRDHLDYHGDMPAYGAAKRRLFAWPGLHAAVINADDAFGRELVDAIAPDVEIIRYGTGRTDVEVAAHAVTIGAAGIGFHLVTPWGEGEVSSRLLGRFNVSNLLAVAACLGWIGLPFARIRDALDALTPVAGRMNRLGGEAARPLVVVDYSHTPDALEQALRSLRAHCAGRLICVFGCGGERDAGKRPEMGAIAEALADCIVVTDDNPRGESGDAIVADIVAGLARPEDARIERDRAHAIALAIGMAKAGDVVLVAGKGHEPYQEIDGIKRPFDDVAIARSALEARPC